MADHPLKPATDRRLGSPLHHQLANQAQAHLSAPELSRIAFQLRSYGVLAEVSLCCPPPKGRFPMLYSPVRHFPKEQALSSRSTCMYEAHRQRSS